MSDDDDMPLTALRALSSDDDSDEPPFRRRRAGRSKPHAVPEHSSSDAESPSDDGSSDGGESHEDAESSDEGVPSDDSDDAPPSPPAVVRLKRSHEAAGIGIRWAVLPAAAAGAVPAPAIATAVEPAAKRARTEAAAMPLSSPRPAAAAAAAEPEESKQADAGCSICEETFQADSSPSSAAAASSGASPPRRTRRFLTCGHSLCAVCVGGMLQGDAGLRHLKCPECTQPQALFDSTGALSDAELIIKMTMTQSQYLQSLRRQQLAHLEPAVPLAAARCCEASCLRETTLWCADGCGEMCAEHSRLRHATIHSHHSRLGLSEKAAHLQRERLKMDEAAAHKLQEANRVQLAKAVQFETQLDGATCAIFEHVKRVHAKGAPELAAIAEERRLLRVREERVLATRKEANDFGQEKGATVATHAEYLRKIKRQMAQLEQLSVQETIQRAKEFDCGRQLEVDHIKFTHSAVWLSIPAASPSALAGPAAASSRAVAAAAIPVAPKPIPWLDDKLREALCGFLSRPHAVSLDNARLLYRASRDGWRSHDFLRCCSEKGPTLTIIKAADTGYLFGAYTAVAWPKPTSVAVNVPDSSGTSFMFSLTNRYDRPFRMSLKDKSLAISTFRGPSFGGEETDAEGKVVKPCNLLLMYGKAANEAKGNASNNPAAIDCAYQLDPWVVAAPAVFQLNHTTLAGSQYFAAAEIECYAL